LPCSSDWNGVCPSSPAARDLEARLQMMCSALAWSYDLLPPKEQILFRRLAVFVGGCTLAEAEAVCLAPEGVEPLGIDLLDGVSALVDQSLIQSREAGGEARFGMLQVIREYALDQLAESGETEALRRAHAAYFCAFADEVGEQGILGARPIEWLDRVERERDNCRAALEWAREHDEDETGLVMAAGLAATWWMTGRLSEGVTWLRYFLEREADTSANAGGVRSQHALAARLLALFYSAFYEFVRGDLDEAKRLFYQTLDCAREARDEVWVSIIHKNLGYIAAIQGDFATGVALAEESVALARRTGDPHALELVLTDSCYILTIAGDWERAEAWGDEARALAHRLEWPIREAAANRQMAWAAFVRGDLVRAEALANQALRLIRGRPLWGITGDSLLVHAMIAGRRGNDIRTARLSGALAAIDERANFPRDQVQQPVLAEAMERARAAMGDDAWQAAFAAGQRLSMDEAIVEALGEDAP
jgi:tetratricopeptide (TPR) repeat protein